MLIHSGSYSRSLFEDYLETVPEKPDSVSKSAATTAIAIDTVRRRREDETQDLAFGARPFILCGLPIRSLPVGTSKYTRRNGRYFLEIVGHPEFGVPYGQDRLILLCIATLAIRQKSALVEFRSASEILYEFGMPANGAHYKRLSEGFKRVFGSSIFFGTKDELEGAEAWSCGRTHFFD